MTRSFSSHLSICLLPAVLLLIHAAIASDPSPCDPLSALYPDQLFLPNTTLYTSSISSYAWMSGHLQPACIIQPQSTSQLSFIIKILADFNTTFAIRGGGHNANPGFSNIDNEVTIDMRGMRQIEVGDGVLRVGAGALWGEVYDAADAKNVSVMGGRISTVGVGGLTTGGGMSIFSLDRGWVCDGVKNFEVILSNSSVINANATSNPSLFRSLKGGLNNFGVVTRFDLTTFKHGPIWGGTTLLSNASESDLIREVTNFKMAKHDPSAHTVTIFGYNLPDKSYMLLNNMWYLKPNANKTSLHGLMSLEPKLNQSLVVASAGEHARRVATPIPAGTWALWGTTTVSISPTILFKIHEIWKSTSSLITSKFPASDINFAFGYQSVPKSTPESGPNSLGIPSTAVPERDWVNLLVTFQYQDGALTSDLEAILLGAIDKVDGIAREEGAHVKYKYMDYAHWKQDVFGGYGAEEVERMKGVAQDYDPLGMFQHQVTGGFKLF
ncbi:FAD binding domain-containing protein [Polyplosphaeria fusca]|uniref:FAD binding domain-containing protein n=1 Tax=Polyplosphaeria fusca TaxID=682080 RepID=A0A9P4UZV9_9PLEO|nr:FAD binding domain-containing protein [Polyplosphaeria fusca]